MFPRLVGEGLFGFAAEGYWIDIGTPERYLQGDVRHPGGKRPHRRRRLRFGGRGVLAEGATLEGSRRGAGHHRRGRVRGASATVGGRAVLGRNVSVGPGSHIEDAVLLDGTTVGSGTRIRSAIIGQAVTIGDRCVIDSGAVVGQGVKLGADNVLSAGARLFPGVELPDGALKF